MLNWLKNIVVNFFKEEEPDPMKYLIAGLGNMGAEYDHTRHNIGFEVLDFLAKEFDIAFKDDYLGDLAMFKFKGRTFVLLKPSTYVNLSGKAVRYWLQKKKIHPKNLLVVLDDLNLSFGEQRLRGKGSDGGHNGLKDINRILASTHYARLRLGIGNDFHKGQQSNFVLGKWTPEEKSELPKILKTAAETVKAYGTIGLRFTMDQFNKKHSGKEEKKSP